MQKKLLTLLLSMTVSLAAGSAALAQSSDAKELKGDPVRVGYVAELSGVGSLYGEASLQSAQLAVEQINKAGGVLDGRPLELVVGDDNSDPRVAQEVWNKLVSDNVDVVIFRETSAARVAVLPIAEKANVPALYANTYEGGDCRPILYVIGETSTMKNRPFLEFLKDKGAQKIYYLGTDYNYPRIVLDMLKPEIEDLGMELVGSDFTPFGTTDYLPIVQKIRDSGADALFLALVGGQDNIAFFKQARSRALIKSLKVVASDQLDDTTLAAVGGAAEGTYADASYFTGIDTPANQKFIGDLKAKFGDKMLAQSLFSEPAYDAVNLYALAVNKAGSTDTSAVLKALSEVEFDGPKGNIKLTADRHAAMPIYAAQAQADGTYKVVADLGLQTPPQQCPADMPFGMPDS